MTSTCHGDPKRGAASGTAPSDVLAARVLESLATLAALVRAEGDTEASIHLESALVTARIAAALRTQGKSNRSAAEQSGAVRIGRDLSVAMRQLDGSVWVRRTEAEGGWTDAPNAEVEPGRRVGPDLGADVVGSAQARAVARGAAGAALLADAMSRWSWVHSAARTTWSCSPSAGRAIVTAIAGGFPVAAVGGDMAGRIDAIAMGVLDGLGWRPHPRQMAAHRR